MLAAQILEGAMLVCFGLSWPFSIARMWRTRRVEGKSAIFLVLVLTGYIAGVAAKLYRGLAAGQWPEAVTLLYAFNAVLVAIDLALYLRLRRLAVA
jgi:hypothetical protein